MNKNNLLAPLEMLLKNMMLSLEEVEDLNDNIRFLRQDTEELLTTIRPIINGKFKVVNAEDELVVKATAVSYRCFGDIIRGLRGIQEVMDNIRKYE